MQIEIVGGHAGDDAPAGLLTLRCGQAHGAGVTRRAIEPDDLDAAVDTARDADRHVALPAAIVVFVEETECGIVVASLELVGKQLRQRAPDAVRDSAVRLGADRAVFEMLDDIGEVRGAMLRNLPKQTNRQHRSDDADQEDDQQQHIERNPQAAAAAQRLLDGGDRRFRVMGRSPPGWARAASGAPGRSSSAARPWRHGSRTVWARSSPSGSSAH